MTAFAASYLPSQASKKRGSAHLVLGALAVVVLLQLHLAFTKSINWDEYWHYSLITASIRGEEVPFLQTPYIRLFSWVTFLPVPTIDQITIIRALTLCFEVIAASALFFAARRFVSTVIALLCALVYVTAGYAFLHGFALRADIIAAAFLMSALAIALRGRITIANGALIVALLLLAFLSTIKSILWAPAFMAVLVLRGEELPLRWGVIVSLGMAFLTLLVAFFLFGGENAQSAAHTIERAGQRMFSGGLFPQARYAIRQIIIAPLLTLILIGFLGWLLRSAKEPRQKIALGLLAAPLLSVILYRNAFAYYFVFILPPVVLAAAPIVEYAARRYGTLALAAALVSNAAVLSFVENRDRMATQREFQSELRGVFPEPVVYIDESGILGDYPRAVLQFASGWSLERYLANREPLYRQRVMTDTVPLMITNSRALINVFEEEPIGNRLLPEDEAFLRANYVSHGGMIYVAGKMLEPGEVIEAAFMGVPGTYRVEQGTVIIDGIAYEEGANVNLDRRVYELANNSSSRVTLRWAAAGKPIDSTIELSNFFTDY